MPRRSSWSTSSASSPITATGSATAARQRGVDLLDVEVIRMPVERQPAATVLCVFEAHGQECVVVPVAHPCGQLLVAPDTTTVLRRAGHATAGAAQCRRRLVEHRLDTEFVVPAVTEVVLVPEPVALSCHQLVEPYVALQHAVLALVEIEVRDE